jgi:hypothetical protein
MDFYDAVKLAKANEHLVGKIVKGATIDEIIIMPTDEEEQKAYSMSFAQNLHAQRAIIPFMASDVEVFALFNKRMMRSENYFVTCNIVNLPKETGVITEI